MVDGEMPGGQDGASSCRRSVTLVWFMVDTTMDNYSSWDLYSNLSKCTLEDS